MNIIREAIDPVDAALGRIADYVIHNDGGQTVDSAAHLLHQNGYVEPYGDGSYFRTLFHEITDDEHARYETLGDLFEVFKSEIRFNMGGGQGFTSSLDSAEEFARGTLHIRDHLIPVTKAEQPLEAHRSIIVIYEASAPKSSILFSMKGLNRFIADREGPGRDKLYHALNDDYDGYGSDDEVFIDTDQGVTIVGIHLFEHSDD